MSARLLLASLWLPPWLLRRELARIATRTTGALDDLLLVNAPEALDEIRSSDRPTSGSSRRRREALARSHTIRVTRLIEILGRDEALRAARLALFQTGIELGREARARLRVGRNRRALVQAARLLYRVLGIAFRAQWTAPGVAMVRIDRCALSRDYSAETCLALSAADEGVVAGLWPGARLEFMKRITQGAPACVASLRLSEKEGEGCR